MSIDGRLIRRVTLSRGDWSLTMSNDADPADDYQPYLQELDGWYGGVDVDADDSQRELGHGTFPEEAHRTSRAITLAGLFVFADERDRAVADRVLSGALGDGGYGTLTCEIEGVETLTATVRLDGQIKHKPIGLDTTDWQMPLIASDPYLYGPARSYQVYPAGYGEGLRFPLFGDPDKPGVLSFGKVAPNTRVMVSNQGNAIAYPTIRIHGDLPSGFRLTDGARVIEFNAPVWQQAPVTIDCAAGAAFVDGRDQTQLCSHRDWFDIPSGGGISPRITAIQQGDGWAEIIAQDTYL